MMYSKIMTNNNYLFSLINCLRQFKLVSWPKQMWTLVNYLYVWDKNNIVFNLLDKQGKLIFQGSVNSNRLDQLLRSI